MRPFQYIAILFTIVIGILLFFYLRHVLSIIWVIVAFALYLGIIISAAANIQWNFFLVSKNNGDRQSKDIALTFDDGPAKETSAILDILKEHNISAAFFCIGENIDADPDIVKRMYREGHVVGNHSNAHSFNFDWKSTVNMLDEIKLCNEKIKEATGQQPLLFRPPYGVTNPNLYRAVLRSGMVSVGWSLRSLDTTAKNGEQLKIKIINKLRGGDIVLLHDSVSLTRETLTDIITEARQKGFTFVRVDELTGVQAYA